MLLRIFILLLLLLNLPELAASASKQKKAESALKKFSIHFPKGWSCIDDKNELPEKIEFIVIGGGNGRFTPSINLASEPTSMTVGEYVAMAKRYHESQGETECSYLGTIQTKAGEAELLQIDRNMTWGAVRFLQASMVKEGIAYVLTATCLQDEFVKLYPAYFEAIQSFCFLGESSYPSKRKNGMDLNNN